MPFENRTEKKRPEIGAIQNTEPGCVLISGVRVKQRVALISGETQRRKTSTNLGGRIEGRNFGQT